MEVMFASVKPVGHMALQTNAIARLPEFEAMCFMAITAGHPSVIHPALQE
jgi:hypothetical protein